MMITFAVNESNCSHHLEMSFDEITLEIEAENEIDIEIDIEIDNEIESEEAINEKIYTSIMVFRSEINTTEVILTMPSLDINNPPPEPV